MLDRTSIRAEEETTADINISPLIDIVFLLLIFFMVTSVFIEETGVDVQKPSAISAQDLEKNSILLAVTAEGEVFFDGQPVPLNSLRGLIARLLRERERPVIILADEEGRTGVLVRVIDECTLAGAAQVSLAASRESP